MGIFDTLTDVFTGRPAKEAGEKSRQFLSDTLNTGNTNITQGYDTGVGAVRGGAGTARGDVTAGYTDARDYLSKGYQPLADLGRKFGGGTDLYLDALGINGPEGNARATASFKPTLSYNFNLDQGLEAINRARNARGMANSGNTDRDAQEFGAGLASKESGAWLDRLAGLINPELSATTGASGISRDQANLASGRGSALANLATGEGTTLANLATGAAGQKVGLATGLASPYAKTYGDEAAAEMGGSANLWNLGLNAAKLATGAAGSGGFGGWLPSSGSYGNNYGDYNPNVPGGVYRG